MSPKVSLHKRYSGAILTALVAIVVFIFLSIYVYLSIKDNRFSLISIFYIIIPLLVLCFTYFTLHDDRNNLTQLEIRDDGIIVFKTFIPWKNIVKVFRMSNVGNVTISFNYEEKKYRASVNTELLLTNQIIQFISDNAKVNNQNFDESQKLTFKDIFERARETRRKTIEN